MVRDTSIESYRTIKESGLLSERRMQVYESLYNHGPMTGTELSSQLQKNHVFINPDLVRSRLIELRDLGVAKEVGETICSLTGMRVILWDVTSGIPETPPKKEKTGEIEKLWDAINELRSEMSRRRLKSIAEDDQLKFKV